MSVRETHFPEREVNRRYPRVLHLGDRSGRRSGQLLPEGGHVTRGHASADAADGN